MTFSTEKGTEKQNICIMAGSEVNIHLTSRLNPKDKVVILNIPN